MSRLTAPVLLLLNGPPGAGKSTLAEALARSHPQRTALDVDVVKHALPAWPQDPHAAGVEARKQVLAQAGRELVAGRSVVIPQLLARPEFAVALQQLADRSGARFAHVLLDLPADALRARLSARRAAPTRPEQAANDAGLAVQDALEMGRRIAVMAADLNQEVLRLDASGPMGAVLPRLEEILADAPRE